MIRHREFFAHNSAVLFRHSRKQLFVTLVEMREQREKSNYGTRPPVISTYRKVIEKPTQQAITARRTSHFATCIVFRALLPNSTFPYHLFFVRRNARGILGMGAPCTTLRVATARGFCTLMWRANVHHRWRTMEWSFHFTCFVEDQKGER